MTEDVVFDGLAVIPVEEIDEASYSPSSIPECA